MGMCGLFPKPGSGEAEFNLIVITPDMYEPCECCGEPLCPICLDRLVEQPIGPNGEWNQQGIEIHLADCPHPGIGQEDEYDYKLIKGRMMARKKANA